MRNRQMSSEHGGEKRGKCPVNCLVRQKPRARKTNPHGTGCSAQIRKNQEDDKSMPDRVALKRDFAKDKRGERRRLLGQSKREAGTRLERSRSHGGGRCRHCEIREGRQQKESACRIDQNVNLL